MDMDDDSGDFDLASKSYIYLELESTTNFKDIDIDKMLEHTSMDDFMRGLYTTGIEKGQVIKQSGADDETKNVMQALLTGVGLDKAEDQQEVKLDFDMNKTQASTYQDEDEMKTQALQNLRERRLRLKQSAIFNAQKKVQA
jgi:hypothetical protein